MNPTVSQVLIVDDEPADALRHAAPVEADIAAIAHDLNDLLLMILLFAGVVRDGMPDDDARKADLDEVLQAAERRTGLARRLLTSSRQHGMVRQSPALAAVPALRPPATAAPPPSPPPAGPPPASTSGGERAGERILLVEDDASLAEVSARILRRRGLHVVVAHTLDTAKSALARAEFDAIVSDVGLTDGSGLDLLRYLRGSNAVTPVVLITGAPSVDVAASAMRLRASNYVQKPIRPDELLRVVGAAIGDGSFPIERGRRASGEARR